MRILYTILVVFLALPACAQRFIATYGTLADLTNANPNNVHQVAVVKGITNTNSSDGTFFHWISGSTATPDGTNIFRAAPAIWPTNGRWFKLRTAGQQLDPLQFGGGGTNAIALSTNIFFYTTNQSISIVEGGVTNVYYFSPGFTNSYTTISNVVSYVSTNTVLVVDSIAQLLALSPTTLFTNAFVSGHTAQGDGGGGWFRYVAGLSTATNLGTIFKPNATTGRWLRNVMDTYSVKWFGAGYGALDDIAAITNAVAASTGLTLEFPSATYTVSEFIELPSRSKIVLLAGAVITVPNSYTPTIVTLTGKRMKPIFYATGKTNIVISGPGKVTMRGTTQFDTNSFMGVWLHASTNCAIQGLEVSHIFETVSANGGSQATNRYYGIFLSESLNNKIVDCYVHDTGDDCINIGRNSGNNVVSRCRAENSNWGHGIQITGDPGVIFGGTASFQNIIANNVCSSNRNSYNQSGITVHGGLNNSIVGNQVFDSGNGIALAGNTKRTIISGNELNNVSANGIFLLSDVTSLNGLTDITIANNQILLSSAATNGVEIAAGSYPITNVVIHGNNITGANGDLQNGVYLKALSASIDTVAINGNTLSTFGQGAVLAETAAATTDVTRIEVSLNNMLNSGVGVYLLNSGAAAINRGRISGNYIQSTRTYAASATAAAGIILTGATDYQIHGNKAIVAGRAFGESGTSTTNHWAFNDPTGSGNTVLALAGTSSYGIDPSQFIMLDGNINNPFTTLVASTNAWASILPVSATLGGMRIYAISDGDAQAFNLRALIGATDPTDTFPAINLVGGKLSGTDKTALGAAETVLALANNTTPLLNVFGDGNAQFQGSIGVPVIVVTNTLTVPNGAAPTTSAFGHVAADNNAWAASRGALQIYDGTANTYGVATIATDTPGNLQVPKWNTGGTITWENDNDSTTPPGGSNTEVQYNNLGSFAGHGGLTYDGAGTLTIGGGGNTGAIVFANLSTNLITYNATRIFTVSAANNADSIFIGQNAGNGAFTTSDNYAFGQSALASITTGGSQNVAHGTSSLPDVTTGDDNVGIGHGSGQDTTTGSRNISVGAFTFTGSAAASYRYAFGYGVTNTADNQLMLGGNGSVLAVRTSVSPGIASQPARAQVGGVILASSTSTGNVGTGEDSLYTNDIPASVMSANLDALEFWAGGTYAATANTKRIRIYFGATTIGDTGALAINSGSWECTGRIIRTGAATQKAIVVFHSNNALLVTDVDYTTPAETLSGAVGLGFTGEATANNDVTIEMLKNQWTPAP